MKINSIQNNKQAFKGYLSNKTFLKGLELISEHSASFSAGLSFISAVALRPLAIKSTPNTKKENKDYLSASSISSGIIKLGIVEAVVLPIENAVKKIDKNPNKYLNKETIKNFNQKGEDIAKSKGYKFATQIIKSGSNILSAIPKSLLTVALIPVVVDKLFKNKKENKKEEKKEEKKVLSFKGSLNDRLAKGIGDILNNKKLQDFANSNISKSTDIARNMSIATDILLAGGYIAKTKTSKKIEENKKNVLIANEVLSTGICLTAGVGIDKLAKKGSKNFIDKFIKENKDNPKLLKYIEGINIARPALIFASIYYGILPIFSTYFADKTENINNCAKFAQKK